MSLPAPLPEESAMAYPAPWRLDRSLPPPWYGLEYHGVEPVDAVTISLLGSARLLAAVPGRIVSGDVLRFAVQGDDPADDSTLIVKWRRSQGAAYLWRATF